MLLMGYDRPTPMAWDVAYKSVEIIQRPHKYGENEREQDRLPVTKVTRRRMDRIRHAHMALPVAAVAGGQGRTHGVMLPAFVLVSSHFL